MTWPKVSIVTVCYNAEKVVERTIKSIIDQTYENIEFVVIDGLSKDGTISILNNYRPYISKLIIERDKSNYDAMNKGYRVSTGDYIWFMNAGDCIYSSDTLKKVMTIANNQDFIYGDAVIVSESGLKRPWHKKKPKADIISWKSFLYGMVICHQSMIVKKNLVSEFKLNPWKISSDLDWTIRLLKKCSSYLDTGFPLCRYLEGGISAQNRWLSVYERYKICTSHFGLIPALIAQFAILFNVFQKGRLD